MENMEELIKKAESVQGRKIGLGRSKDGQWYLNMHYPQGSLSTVQYLTFDDCIAELRQLAKPKPPATVQVTVPFEYAKNYAQNGLVQHFRASCQEAINPYLE